jgi:hypothetical protein
MSRDKSRPILKKPNDENTKIWRYMDFTKFVSILDKRALFLSRIDRLGDKFEGSLPKEIPWNHMKQELKKLGGKEGGLKKQKYSSAREIMTYLVRSEIPRVFVNSWHMNENESAAMWKLYLKSDEGLAIQSTYKRLLGCFNKEDNVVVGLVEYVDYTSESKVNIIEFPYICKRKSFEHEKELRALIKIPLSDFLSHDGIPDGLHVSVSLDTLVEKVYISPTAEPWFKELIISVMQKYQLSKSVTKSSLSDDPIY